MSVSHWQRTTSPTRLHADLVIIGAGIAGISAALHAQRRGLRTIVIDSGAIGCGASTRNAGYLMRGCADNYAAAIKQFGATKAKLLWQLTQDNLLGLMREGVLRLPGSRAIPSVLCALERSEQDQLAESFALLTRDGFDVQWLDPSSSSVKLPSISPLMHDSLWQSKRVLAGLVNPHDAACNSHEVMQLLASRVTAPIITHDEVFAIEPQCRNLCVRSREHELHASHVLCCTNAYAPRLFPQLEHRIQPNRGQMFACKPQGISLAASYYLNFGHEYIRQAADGTVLVGGCRSTFAEAERTTLEEPTQEVQTALEAFARSVLAIPSSTPLNITARWTGLMGFSSTGLPIITRVACDGSEDVSENLWFCGGFTGHGMSMAYATTQHALDVIYDNAANHFA